jgi:hypothetical protein
LPRPPDSNAGQPKAMNDDDRSRVKENFPSFGRRRIRKEMFSP